MFKSGNNSSSLLPSSGASSPTYRSNHPITKVLKSKPAKTILIAYVGFCALFTLKHIFSYHSQPKPIVYKHFDLQRTYDAGKSASSLANLLRPSRINPSVLIQHIGYQTELKRTCGQCPNANHPSSFWRIDASYSVVANLSSSVILSKMFTFHTPAITDSIQPFYIRSTSTPKSEDITLATFVPQDELSELASLVERYPGIIYKRDALQLLLAFRFSSA